MLPLTSNLNYHNDFASRLFGGEATSPYKRSIPFITNDGFGRASLAKSYPMHKDRWASTHPKRSMTLRAAFSAAKQTPLIKE